jgi:replication factor C small subunit
MPNIIEKYLWIEKYRPRELNDVILPESYRNCFNQYLNDGECPSLLFIGAPGSGKTTIAKILIDKLLGSRDDVLELNGSSMNGIDVVRDVIEEFLKNSPMTNKPKIVFIDEFDGMSTSAQGALRGIIETYHDMNRFIFTANYKHKIQSPIFSRVVTYEFKKLPQDYVERYCFDILEKEGIVFDDDYVKASVNTFYPDIRKIVNQLQGSVVNNRLESNYDALVSYEKIIRDEILKMTIAICAKDINTVKIIIKNVQKILSENEIDYVQFYETCFYDDSLPIWAKACINEFANRHVNSLIPPMNLISCIYQIYRVGEELNAVRR